MIGRNTAMMFGDSQVDYGDISLKSANIELDLGTSQVYAYGATDSIGDLSDTPVFKSGNESYQSETMSYNFKSERGYITNVITQQGEGYLTGGQSKKNGQRRVLYKRRPLHHVRQP